MGNGMRASLSKRGRIDRSIAHNELGASAKFAALEGYGRVLPGNRGSARGKLTPARKRNFGRARHQNSEQLSVELKIVRLQGKSAQLAVLEKRARHPHIGRAIRFDPTMPGRSAGEIRRNTLRTKRSPLRPERVIALERFVRNELSLQRLLAASRRAASTRMSAIRRAAVASPPALFVPFQLLRLEVA